METNYHGSVVTSFHDGETTDNLIASALKTIPKSAVAAVMPVVKTKGPTSQWVEPYYADDKVELVSTPVSMYETVNNRRQIRFSCNAVEDICRMYTPEAFTSVVHNWVLFQKNKQQRKDLIDILKSPAVNDIPPEDTIPNLKNPLSEDNSKLIQTRILQAINDIKKDFQLGDEHFSVVAPYEIGFALTQLRFAMRDEIHVMYDDTIDKVYIFPTGSEDLSRAGLAIFEYADEVQKAIDHETGDLAYWVYNRSKVILSPIHAKHPIVRNLAIEP